MGETKQQHPAGFSLILPKFIPKPPAHLKFGRDLHPAPTGPNVFIDILGLPWDCAFDDFRTAG